MAKKCIWGKEAADWEIDFTKKFFEAYKESNKIFLLSLQDSHEGSGEIIKYTEPYLLDLFNYLNSTQQLDDTLTILMSDHGFFMPWWIYQLFNTIKEIKGRIDTVINSAGIALGELISSPKGVHKNDSFKRVFDINTFGSFLVSKHASKLMIDTMDKNSECNGNIILIASVAGIEGQKGQVAYGGSKSAILGMTLPMARDLGKFKIRVNSIAPGIILTPMTMGIIETGPMKSIVAQTPLGVTGKPEHIALTTEFIVKNDFINGTHIRVDGGVRFPQY